MTKIWCEINTKHLEDNILTIKKHIGDKKLISVLKANAYGLGVREVSTIIDNYTDMYAVSNIHEYEMLNTNKDVLIMSPLCSIEDFMFAKNKKNLILSIDNENILRELDQTTKYRVHICVDTTNHRVGVGLDKLKDLIDCIESKYKNITIEGIYTHFHNCSNIEETKEQIISFKNTVTLLQKNNYIIHCVASSVACNQYLLDMCSFSNACRIGNMLYGFAGNKIGTKKVHNFYAKIIQKHSIKKGELIGFGASYEKADKDMIIGIIETGNFYGLGSVRESIENPFISAAKSLKYNIKGISYIKIKNSKKDIKIIGFVNMNSLILDITDIPDENIVELLMSPILADSGIHKISV